METKIKKKKTPRCKHSECKRRLKLTDFECPACFYKFCSKHRYFSDHRCEKLEEYDKKGKENFNKKLNEDSTSDVKIKII